MLLTRFKYYPSREALSKDFPHSCIVFYSFSREIEKNPIYIFASGSLNSWLILHAVFLGTNNLSMSISIGDTLIILIII